MSSDIQSQIQITLPVYPASNGQHLAGNKETCYKKPHGKTIHSTVNHRIHGLKFLNISLLALKARTVFALPICHIILLLSQVKHRLPLWPPTSCQSFLPPPPLHQAPGPKLLSKPLCVLPTPLPQALPPQTSGSLTILLQALEGFFWTKFQITSAQQFTSEISPGCKAHLPNTRQSCQKLVQIDNTYSLPNQLQESQE